MSKAKFIQYKMQHGVRFAAYMANAMGIPLATVQLWIRSK